MTDSIFNNKKNTNMAYNSDYDVRLATLEAMGGDTSRVYNSVYDIDLEILRLTEEGGGGGGGTSSGIKVVTTLPSNPTNLELVYLVNSEGRPKFLYQYATELTTWIPLKSFIDNLSDDEIQSTINTIISLGVGSSNYKYDTPSVVCKVNTMYQDIYMELPLVCTNNDNIWFGNVYINANSEITISRFFCNYYGSRWEYETRSDRYDPTRYLVKDYVYKYNKLSLESGDIDAVSAIYSEVAVDGLDYVVLKTTVPAWDGVNIHNQTYKAMNDQREDFVLSKFGGIRFYQRDWNNSNGDLVPDGRWYPFFADINAATYSWLYITKAEVNSDGNLDVYIGIHGTNVMDKLNNNEFRFKDCTMNDRDEQGDWGNYAEKNWTLVDQSMTIDVKPYTTLRTYIYPINPTTGQPEDRLFMFKKL